MTASGLDSKKSPAHNVGPAGSVTIDGSDGSPASSLCSSTPPPHSLEIPHGGDLLRSSYTGRGDPLRGLQPSRTRLPKIPCISEGSLELGVGHQQSTLLPSPKQSNCAKGMATLLAIDWLSLLLRLPSPVIAKACIYQQIL